jgi:hypothetical protein
MNLFFAVFFACGGAETPDPQPDPEVAEAAADAVCKLLQGALETCEAKGQEVSWGTRRLSVEATLLQAEERFGQYAFEAVVTVAEGDVRFSSPAVGFGAAREVSIEKGLHEWAVVSGVAVVDALLANPTRPALRALDPSPTLPAGVDTLGAFTVLRGYSLLRGDRPPEGGVPHAQLLGVVSTMVADLDVAVPHVLSVHRASGLDGTELTCWADGEPAEALCTALEPFSWPSGSNWEVKQTYVLAP